VSKFYALLSKIRGESVTMGLDIGHNSIKLAMVEHRNGVKRLIGAGIHTLKPGTIADGDFKDREALLESLVSLINRHKPMFKDLDIVISVPWSIGVVAERVPMRPDPTMREAEAIRFEAAGISPFDGDDITLGFHVMDRRKDGDLDVLLVAAKNAVLSKRADFFVNAGVRIHAFDVDSFAVYNAYTQVANQSQSQEPAFVAILNIGHTYTNITFVSKGKYNSTRDIQSVSINNFVQNLSRVLGVSPEEALPIFTGEQKQGFQAQDLEDSIASSLDDLAQGIRAAIDFQSGESGGQMLEKLYVCGGGAAITDLHSFLADHLGVVVENLDPLRYISYSREQFSGDIDPSVSNTLAVALGLALRKF
jgi:type IV pilus assembly protein PilM